MRRLIIFILVIHIIAPLSFGVNKRKLLQKKQRDFEMLQTYLQSVRDSLESEISQRWRNKQNYIKQREIDKEELTRISDIQERTYAELSRIKETKLTREKQLEDEKAELKDKEEAWKLVKLTLEELFQKEADNLMQTFPLDFEKRRAELENLRREYRKNYLAANSVLEYTEYRKKYLNKGSGISILKSTLIPEGEEPQLLSIARFGNVFAYGINKKSIAYYLRQTGQLGAERYKTVRIKNEKLKNHLLEKFPKWIEKNKVTGRVVTDVMQNEQAKILLSGEKQGIVKRVVGFIKKGGPVMVPIFFLLLWGVILIVLKLIQFSKKHKANKSIYNEVAKYLDNNEMDKALNYVKSIKSVVARVVEICLEHSQWSRKKAEKAVKELLVDELPQLNKSLTTLAVIAGASPLLGLLGTVTGMINLFEVITHYGTGDPRIMAGGISEALLTTQMGLAIAIPILLMHNYLRNKKDYIRSEMEKHAIKILNRLWPEE